MLPALAVRPLVPADRAAVLAEIHAWSPAIDLDRLLPGEDFTQADCSLLATDPDGVVVGLVLALKSHRRPETGYLHFIWVSPDHRNQGLGADLYRRVFALLRAAGCTRVEADTSPQNRKAIAFHRRLGFSISDPGASPDCQPGGPDVRLVRMTLNI